MKMSKNRISSPLNYSFFKWLYIICNCCNPDQNHLETDGEPEAQNERMT